MMKKKDDADNRQSSLERYLSNEITDYYGEDIIKKANSSPVPPARKRRSSNLMFGLTVLCAVLFLTGAVMLSGVIFTAEVSELGSESSDTANSDLAAYASENTDTDKTSDTSQKPSKDSLASKDTDTDKMSDTSQKPSEDSSDYKDTDTEKTSDTSQKSSEDRSDYKDTNTDKTSDKSEDTHEEESDIKRHTESFELPVYPDESGYEPPDDIDNNSSTNPYGNVKTGRRARAGVGVLLMILSVMTAFALNKIRRQLSENDNYD